MGKTNWLEVGIGTALILPIGPEDIFTGGAGVIPSAAVGLGLVLHGFGFLK